MKHMYWERWTILISLKIRGLVAPDEDDCCGIVVDRLQETLGNRIIRWNKESKRFKIAAFGKLRDWNGEKRKEFLIERLSVALGIARALAHLHNKKIIYRDLKPGNVGFGGNDEPVLFDMGLCRERPSGYLGERFEMSGKTGTIRYMSPEVRMLEPYNEKADVFSLALERPYDGYTRRMHIHRVAKLGERPPLDPSWPSGIRDLLKRCWDAEPSSRLTMAKVAQILEEALTALLS